MKSCFSPYRTKGASVTADRARITRPTNFSLEFFHLLFTWKLILSECAFGGAICDAGSQTDTSIDGPWWAPEHCFWVRDDRTKRWAAKWRRERFVHLAVERLTGSTRTQKTFDGPLNGLSIGLHVNCAWLNVVGWINFKKKMMAPQVATFGVFFVNEWTTLLFHLISLVLTLPLGRCLFPVINWFSTISKNKKKSRKQHKTSSFFFFKFGAFFSKKEKWMGVGRLSPKFPTPDGVLSLEQIC